MSIPISQFTIFHFKLQNKKKRISLKIMWKVILVMSILYVLKIAKREVHMCSVSIPYHRLQFSIFHTCPKIYNSSNWEGEACYVICWNSPPLLRVSRDLCPWVGELSRDTSISLYVISCQGGGRWVKEELGSSDL